MQKFKEFQRPDVQHDVAVVYVGRLHPRAIDGSRKNHPRERRSTIAGIDVPGNSLTGYRGFIRVFEGGFS